MARETPIFLCFGKAAGDRKQAPRLKWQTIANGGAKGKKNHPESGPFWTQWRSAKRPGFLRALAPSKFAAPLQHLGQEIDFLAEQRILVDQSLDAAAGMQHRGV